MVKTFLENNYGKNKKDTEDRSYTIAKVELELARLINSIANEPSPVVLSKRDKQNAEIRMAALQQATVYFRKALRDLQRGAKYLR